jgi:mannose-6-phosphate isomerase-like protein (cupin superfamily)
MSKINFSEKFKLFSDHWSPKLIAQMNDYHFKLVKIKGDFTWHHHDETDEVFMVIDGEMRMDYEEEQINIQTGEMIVVPRGKIHKPYAKNETQIMVIEPAGTLNTGDVKNEKTVNKPEWI